MTGRVNRRGWIVLESIGSTDGSLCVDFLQDPAGGYGFAHFRTDSEDRGAWTVIGGTGQQRFASVGEAIAVAMKAVAWLQEERRPRESLLAWGAALEADR